MKRRGSTLGTVLLTLTIALTLVLTSASVGIFNLRFATSLDNRDHARNLAESAINRALAKIVDAENYGVDHLPTSNIEVFQDGLPEGASGFCSFNSAVAHARGIRFSTNNLVNPAATAGDHRQVPGGSVHLLGIGTCGDATSRLEMVFYRPPFPKGMATSGKINAQSVTAVGMKSGTSFTGTIASIPPDDKMGGTLFTNSPAADAAIIGGMSNITGGAGAVGGIRITGSRVGGEVRQYSAAQQVPTADVARMVSQIRSQRGLANFVSGTPLKKFAHINGPATVGDVVLDGGALAVTGALTVNGKITGQGAVLVDGSISVSQAGTLESGKTTGIMATGDITLRGSGSGTYIQGQVYSGGTIDARDLTVVGSIIANGGETHPELGVLNLRNVTLIQCPASVSGGLAPPQTLTLGSGDDGTIVTVGSRYDMETGSYLFFGHGDYSTNPPNGDGELDPVDNQADWAPSSRVQFEQSLRLFMNSDRGNYYDSDVKPQLTPILDALEGKGSSPYVIDFNVNNSLSRSELSRLLLFREVTE